MLKSIAEKVLGPIILTVLAIAFLYDPDGLAVGSQLFGAPSVGLETFAALIGNLAWIMGILFWILALAMTFLSLSEKLMAASVQKLILNSIRDGKQPLDQIKSGVYSHIMMVISGTIAAFGLGSGFVFTGLGWVLAILMITVYRKKMIEGVTAHINETLKSGFEGARDITPEVRRIS